MPWRLCLLGVIVSAGASGASAAPTDSIWWAMTAFGDNGLVTVQDSSAIAYPNAVAVAPDGSVLVAGDAGAAIVLFRFSAGGRRVGFGAKAQPRLLLTQVLCNPGLAVRPDGTIVTACGDVVAALRKDGTVESLARVGYANLGPVAADGLGRTVAAGADGSGGYGVLVRFLRNGSLDRSFGTSGRVALPSGAAAVAIDGGRILVAVDGSILGYLDDGSLDQSFGTDGTATVAGFTASSVVAQRDGGIVAAGARGDDVAVVRLRKDGTPDPSFGTAGMTSWHAAPLSTAVALASRRNGAVDVAVLGTFPAVNVGQDTWEGWRIQRLTATGRLWRHADGPTELIDPTEECVQEVPVAVAEQPDGKTIVAGTACPDRVDADTYSLLMRYTPELERDVGRPLKLAVVGKPVARTAGLRVSLTLHVALNGPARFIARVRHVSARAHGAAGAPLRLLGSSSLGGVRAPSAPDTAAADLSGGPATIHLELPAAELRAGTRYAVSLVAYDARGYSVRALARLPAAATVTSTP